MRTSLCAPASPDWVPLGSQNGAPAGQITLYVHYYTWSAGEGDES
jgi:hypothetical protein